MSKIGTFKKVGASYAGEIITLSVQNRDVRIVPDHDPKAPPNSYKVLVGSAHVGWARGNADASGADQLILEIDDPSFVGPITAELRASGEGDYVLIWDRKR